MPSPIGHALAGVAAAWTVDLVPGRRAWRATASTSWYRRAGGGLTVLCALLGALPDADLLLFMHRTMSHSVGTLLLVTGIAAVVTGLLTERPVARVALMCGGAYATHVLLDWLGADTRPPYGLQVFWPFSTIWFASGWDVFREITRRQVLTAASMRVNLLAVAQELAILGPVLVALWLVRVKALARLAAQMPRRDHPPQ